MKQINVKLENEYIEILKRISKETGHTQTEIIRRALKAYDSIGETETKALATLENQNQQLQVAIKGLEFTIKEKDDKYETVCSEKDQKYTEMVREKDEKYAVLETIQREQANVYNTILKQKDDLLTEIKGMSMWKRAFLKLA